MSLISKSLALAWVRVKALNLTHQDLGLTVKTLDLTAIALTLTVTALTLTFVSSTPSLVTSKENTGICNVDLELSSKFTGRWRCSTSYTLRSSQFVGHHTDITRPLIISTTEHLRQTGQFLLRRGRTLHTSVTQPTSITTAPLTTDKHHSSVTLSNHPDHSSRLTSIHHHHHHE